MNPDVKERPRVGGEELEAVLAENAELMDCARDILEQMFSSMQEAVSALSLVSARGVTLYISNRVSHRAYYPDALVGSINTEEARGTNGIGTCLAERRPVEIIGAEHFRFSGECWSCSAAPIFSPDGRLIGVLNVTQPRKQYHAHTLGMVKAAVCAITEQLRLRSLLQQRETIMEMLDDGVLVLSASGGVDMMNRKAAVMFGHDVQPGRPRRRGLWRICCARARCWMNSCGPARTCRIRKCCFRCAAALRCPASSPLFRLPEGAGCSPCARPGACGRWP